MLKINEIPWELMKGTEFEELTAINKYSDVIYEGEIYEVVRITQENGETFVTIEIDGKETKVPTKNVDQYFIGKPMYDTIFTLDPNINWDNKTLLQEVSEEFRIFKSDILGVFLGIDSGIGMSFKSKWEFLEKTIRKHVSLL